LKPELFINGFPLESTTSIAITKRIPVALGWEKNEPAGQEERVTYWMSTSKQILSK
jgi:hypothetical protein